jgi:Ca-activated chloride channel family protein
MLPLQRVMAIGGGHLCLLRRRAWVCALAAILYMGRAQAQDDQLNKVHVQPPGSTAAPVAEPAGAEANPQTGIKALKVHPGSFIRMNVDMVLVPVTITDPLNRLVTGLERKTSRFTRTTESS